VNGAFAFLMGIISGYPIGAKIVTDFREREIGFLFRFWGHNDVGNGLDRSAVGSRPDPTRGDLGTILQNAISKSINNIIMIGGFIVLFSVIISILQQSRIFELLSYAINPILSLFSISTKFSIPLLSGLVELTNGVNAVSSIAMKAISTNVILCAFLLGFGGLSILLQVFTIISKTDISIKPYFIGKLLQGCFAAFYTWLALGNFHFLNLDILTK